MVDFPTLVIKELRGRSRCAIAVASPLVLLALLLPVAARIAAIVGILGIVALLLDDYRLVVDPVGRTIRIQTLWLGWRERGAVTYRFSDVVRLEKATLGDTTTGYRWKFRGGATYELSSPLDERLYELFREKEDVGVMKRPGTADYSYGPQWRLAKRGHAVVLEPTVGGEALATWSFCGVIALTFIVLAARGAVSPAVAVGSVAMCACVALLVALYVKSEARKGPWVRYDRVRGMPDSAAVGNRIWRRCTGRLGDEARALGRGERDDSGNRTATGHPFGR